MKSLKQYYQTNKKIPSAYEPRTRIHIRLIYGFIGILVLMLLWDGVAYILLTDPSYQHFNGFLPFPAIKALFYLFQDTTFWLSVGASLRRVFIGILCAFLLGMPIGIMLGYSKRLTYITYPPFQFIRMISPLAWMPIALLLFASFEAAIYFLIVMATIWPIMFNTVLGVSRVNPKWISMARNQGAMPYQLICYIFIPASIPYIITSLRLALGVAWIVLVPAEFLGVNSGLGYLINDARDTMEYDRLMAIVLAIGIIGVIVDGALYGVQKSFHWNWG